MPKLKTKIIRVKDADGIWHDLPAAISMESILAAERAADSELNARQSYMGASGAASTASLYAGEAINAKNAAVAAQGLAENAASGAGLSQGLAETAAGNAEAWAVGQRGGVDVEDTDDTYHNNSKYYAGRAAEDGEAWAEGTRGGTPVGSSDPAYHHNAKYHAGQAEAWATGGSSGTPSATNNSKYYSEQSAASATSAAEAALTGNLAPSFSPSEAYNAGDPVIYNGTLYWFTADHAAGAWTGSDAVADKIAPDVAELKSAIGFIDGLNAKALSSNTIIDRNNSASAELNSNRVYLISEIYSDVGYKEIKFKVSGSTNCELYLIKKNGSNEYEIIETIVSSPNDGFVTFTNIFTGKGIYIGFSGASVYYRNDYTVSIDMKRGWKFEINNNVLGTLEDVTYGIVGTIITLEQKEIDPDDFSGTDDAKLQAAFDALTNGGIIKIKRKYTLTTQIEISHNYSQNHHIYVVGYTNNSIIHLSSVNAYFKGTSYNTGGVTFKGIVFTGISGENGTIIISPGTGEGADNKCLVNITFEDCGIYGHKGIAFGSHYLQGLNIIKCKIRNVYMCVFTNSGILYGFNIFYSVVEGCTCLARIYYPEACNICYNTIEGNPGIPINVRSLVGGGLNIEGNYFEANNSSGEEVGLCIDLSNMPDNKARNIRIVGNFFYETAYCIKLPNNGLGKNAELGGITIMNNSALGTAPLIKGNSAAEYNEVLCLSNNGTITDLPSTALKVLSPFDLAKVLTI